METIHVALTFDDNYTEHSIVLMTSILHNKGDENINFHIIDGGINDENKVRLKWLKNCKVEFYQIDKNIFKNYQKTDYYPVSMLYTMVLAGVIPVGKLIYLDSDMVVNFSLKELWDTDLGENYIAAVEDANGKKYAKRYGLKPDSKFFNTGTMLLNCKKWREDDIANRAIKIWSENIGTKFGLDQTILNQLFENKVKFIDLKWNLQYCPINVWSTYDDKIEYKNAIKSPSIIHYVGDYKPWKQGLGCFNPKQDDYLKYHKMTAYALEDYTKWKLQDKFSFHKGLFALVKRYPLFMFKKEFWMNSNR